MTNSVSTMENAVSAISATKRTTGRGDGYFLDGMAWLAHVNDIRPDKASNRPTGTIENVTSFFVDVLEPLDWNPLASNAHDQDPIFGSRPNMAGLT